MTAEKGTEGGKCAHEDHTIPTFSALSLEEGFSENVKLDISMTTDRITEDGTYIHVGCTTPTPGDVSARVQDEENLPKSDFCSMYNLKNLITEPTCYKNAENPTLIDVILTNRFRSFRESRTIATGLSDYHKMIYTILKFDIYKKDPLLLNYRSNISTT